MEFDWDEHNLGHIAEHGVSPEEAESVLRGEPLFLKIEFRNDEERVTYLGPGLGQRMLVVVITVRSDKLRVVTAFPANRKNRNEYDVVRGKAI